MVCVVWQVCTTVPLIHWYLSTKLQDIQKEDSNPGADYLLGFGNKFDGCHPVIFNIDKHFNFAV
jgi:hypothetical protein